MKKVLTLSLLLLGMQQMYSSNEVLADKTEWLTQSNEKYVYNKTVTTKPAKSFFGLFNNTIEKSEDIKIINHTFNDGITRTKKTIEPIEDSVQTTVETWITVDPSYFIWLNTALITGVLMTSYFSPQIDYQIFKTISDNYNLDTAHNFPKLSETPGINQIKNSLYLTEYLIKSLYRSIQIYNDPINPKFTNTTPLEHITKTTYNFATDPIIATLLASGTAYYLYQQYLKYQASQADKKKADLEAEIKQLEDFEDNQDQQK